MRSGTLGDLRTLLLSLGLLCPLFSALALACMLLAFTCIQLLRHLSSVIRPLLCGARTRRGRTHVWMESAGEGWICIMHTILRRTDQVLPSLIFDLSLQLSQRLTAGNGDRPHLCIEINLFATALNSQHLSYQRSFQGLLRGVGFDFRGGTSFHSRRWRHSGGGCKEIVKKICMLSVSVNERRMNISFAKLERLTIHGFFEYVLKRPVHNIEHLN